MTSMIFFSLSLFFIGVFSLIWNQKHILSILLSMEIMVLGLFLILISSFFSNFNLEIIMFYLILVICESCLGLSILISLINFYNSDLFKSLTILKS